MVASLSDLHLVSAFSHTRFKFKRPGWVPGEDRWEQGGEGKVDSYLNDEGLREVLCFQDRALFQFRFANCCSQ